MININNKYQIGTYVKAYNNIITPNGVSQQLSITIGMVKEIIIQNDIITNEPFILYKLDTGAIFDENSLMKVMKQ